jgi:phenylpyruvate tautomerase PptA (4-oxalocrotonate tautomerase family)
VPVVRIRALPQPGPVDIAAALSSVATELAALLGEEPQGTWATWETIEPGRYAEGSDSPTTQPRHTHPPLVTVTAFEGRPAELVEQMLTCVAGTVARELDLGDGNVFVTYDEVQSGRVYTGGRVLRS